MIIVVKKLSRIVAYLILFVILPASAVNALEIVEFFRLSAGLDFVKKPELAASFQPDYRVAEGIELSFAGGAYLGLAGLVSQTATSPINRGVLYRGFVTLGGTLHTGYIHPQTLFNLVRLGAAAVLRAEFARYFDTDLLFFYLSAAVTPEASFQLADTVAVRFGLPLSYSFREELSFHIRIGASVTFLIG